VLLAARMLIVAGIERDETAAQQRVRQALESGAGLEKFGAIIEFQGGDRRVIDQYDRLPSAPDRYDVNATRDGYVSTLRAEPIGRAAVGLGAGRGKLDDVIDPGVGIEVVAHVGSAVRTGDAILRVHHRGGRGLPDALPLLAAAITIADEPLTPHPIVVERVSAKRGNG